MSAHRDASPWRSPGTGSAGEWPAVHRADGDLQLGVGPGALLVKGPAPELMVGVMGAALLPDLVGEEHRGRCAVVGQGPLAARLRRALGDGGDPSDAALTVLVHQHVVPPEVGVATARQGGMHLPVVVQARRVVVGPLCGDPRQACLHCLDLHRRDRDPSWPDLATWLGHPARQVEPVAAPAEVLAVVEGLVGLVVGSTLSGRQTAPGLAHEVGARPPHLVSRTWQRHPGCAWHPGGAGPG